MICFFLNGTSKGEVMQFRDLKKQYSILKEDIDKALLEAAASGAFIMGPQVRELEQDLASYVGVKHCLGCANGTDALTLALKAWGIGAGDAVFVPDFTFFSSAEVVSLEGATPVFVDVCEETFNIDAEDLERAIKMTLSEGRLTPKVIVAVDLFGLPANYPRIRAIAGRYGLLILEDGAQGFGGSINGRLACSFGDIATTSFFPAKPLGCYGDGGAVFTDNDEWAALMASYRFHGKGSDKYDNVRIGLNSRLDTLQAAILKVKLKAFRDYELDAVNVAADHYTSLLRDSIATPVILEGFRSSWAQYTLRLRDAAQRDDIQASLKAAGIPAMVYYPKPMHLQTAFSNVVAKDAEDFCPVATSLCDRVLSLPMHPYLTDEDIDSVCSTIAASLR